MFGKPIFIPSPEYKDKRCNWEILSGNPDAIHILKTRQNKVVWTYLSRNSAAGYILKENLHRIDWHNLSKNTSSEAIKILERNLNRVDWIELSKNGSNEAIKLLMKHPNKINWRSLSKNTNPAAIQLFDATQNKIEPLYLALNPFIVQRLKVSHYSVKYLEQLASNPSQEAIQLIEKYLEQTYHIGSYHYHERTFVSFWRNISGNHCVTETLLKYYNHINWYVLSSNSAPAAVQMLMANPDKINWRQLSLNTSPDAIQMLENNLSKVNWWYLSGNVAALRILDANRNKIKWHNLCSTPAVIYMLFQLDTVAMRSAMQPFAEELAQHVFHPERLARQAERCGVQVWELLEMYE